VARAGISPAINLEHSYTKNADLLINDKQKEGLKLIRTMLANTSSAVAIPQLLSMMDKTDTNEMLLLKMKDWFALMNR
jgi:transcription termination factor Rho